MDEGPKRPGAVESTAVAVAAWAFALSFVLLRGATPVPPSLFDALALVAALWGPSLLVHRRLGAFAATLLRGAGLVGGVLMLGRALVPPFDAVVLPASLLLSGATLLQARARSGKGGLVAETLGLVLVAAGWAAALALAPRFPEPDRLRFALFVAAPVAALGLLLRLLARRRGYDALAPMPVGVLLAAAMTGAYLGYRGLVADRVANLPLYEWTLGVGVAALLLGRLRRQARAREVAEAWESDARRHTPDVVPLPDPRMGPLAAAVGRYLQRGEGFEDYRAALGKAAEPASPFRKALEDLRPVPPVRGRAARAAAQRRVDAHRALMLTLHQTRGNVHGTAPPPLRPDP